MWREDSIKIGEDIFHYWIKQYGGGSVYGIKGGRISKLMIKVEGKVTAHYERGWDVEPMDEPTRLAYSILLQKYN